MEFTQFHPTCLYNLQVKNFLITEAARRGRPAQAPPASRRRNALHAKFDKRAELAPRDIVARALDHEITDLGSNM